MVALDPSCRGGVAETNNIEPRDHSWFARRVAVRPRLLEQIRAAILNARNWPVVARKVDLPGGASFDLEHRLTYRFGTLSTRVIRCVARMYGPKYGLLPSSWKAMGVIGRYGPVSAKEVCERTTVEPDKVTRAVDRLVQLGYVSRKRNPRDGRCVVLSLSPLGRRVYRDIEGVTRRIEVMLLDALSSRERATLNRIFDKLEAQAREHISDSAAYRRFTG